MSGMPPDRRLSGGARKRHDRRGLSPRVAALLGDRGGADADARVPVGCFTLFAAALRHGRDPAFPLRVARAVRPRLRGARLRARARRHRGRISRLVRYGHDQRLGRLAPRRQRRLELRWCRAGRRTPPRRQQCAVASRRAAASTRAGPAGGHHFRHAAPGDARAHAAWFGQIRWGSTWDGVVLPRAIGTARPPAGDAALSRFFEDLLRRQADPRRAALSARVREQLVADLPAGIPSARDLAQRLGLSERSLRRGLATEGHSYRALVDDHRQVCAHDLRAAGKPATEVAFLLGFSDTSAFSRAYRRWYGTSWRATAARPR
jgi:AraC-like DNA-binding protein